MDNVYVTGDTYSSGWMSDGFDTSYNGYSDAFVVKLSKDGAHLWSTFLGGSSDDEGYGIAVDGLSNVFVTGLTYSSGWVSGGFDTSFNGGQFSNDAFVVKLSKDGAHLWSTYLRGSEVDVDIGYGIAVDTLSNLYVTGHGGLDTTIGSGPYVVKLSKDGAHFWSTYLGEGSGEGRSIAVDASGKIYVAGKGSKDGKSTDAFVAKLSDVGMPYWTTWLGGSEYDTAHSIAVDASGYLYVTGQTESSGWPSGGFDTNYNGSTDAFVAKLSNIEHGNAIPSRSWIFYR